MSKWCIRAEVEFDQSNDYLLPGEGSFFVGGLTERKAKALLPKWREKAKTDGFVDGHGQRHPLKVWIEKA